MPRPKTLPTPVNSTDITAQQSNISSEMETTFVLPPPAIQSSGTKKASSKQFTQPAAVAAPNSPPLSPDETKNSNSIQRKRTLSGSTKPGLGNDSNPTPSIQQHDNDLPPPPTRTRKIIQMKPKQASGSAQEAANSTQVSLDAKSTSTPTSAVPTTKRKGQPSATSAAGRKMARKTAHSIIERRRRSKMNEEFGVLKDMIPACTGVEMHKLAILQAGIEYLRYLEGCVKKLKDQHKDVELSNYNNKDREAESMDVDDRAEIQSREASPNVLSDEESIGEEISIRPQTESRDTLRNHRTSSIATSATTSTFASPDLRPVNSLSSIAPYHQARLPSINYLEQKHGNPGAYTAQYTTSPPFTAAQTQTPTGVSPAFNAFNFSPDLTRSSTRSSYNTSIPGKPSPSILPLPQAALPMPIMGGGHAEATATAALMMLTNDRRGSVSMARSGSSKGMSVRDLLSS